MADTAAKAIIAKGKHFEMELKHYTGYDNILNLVSTVRPTGKQKLKADYGIYIQYSILPDSIDIGDVELFSDLSKYTDWYETVVFLLEGYGSKYGTQNCLLAGKTNTGSNCPWSLDSSDWSWFDNQIKVKTSRRLNRYHKYQDLTNVNSLSIFAYYRIIDQDANVIEESIPAG